MSAFPSFGPYKTPPWSPLSAGDVTLTSDFSLESGTVLVYLIAQICQLSVSHTVKSNLKYCLELLLGGSADYLAKSDVRK